MNLFPYQKEDVNKAISLFNSQKNNNAVYLAHEPGLGKTIMALEIAMKLKFQTENILIVCPSSAKGVWRATLEDNYNIKSSVISTGKDKLDLASGVIIVSYDLAISPEIAIQLLRLENFILICDEAHSLGAMNSQRSKLILKEMFPIAKYKIFLSGSVTRNKGIQLWPIFHTILPHKIPPYWPFAHKYCVVKFNRFGKIAGGLKNKEAAEELGNIARDNFLIRRKKVDVLKELPEKLEQKVVLQLDNLDRFKKAAKDFESELIICQDTEKPPSENLATA